jgi:hypothetical protein
LLCWGKNLSQIKLRRINQGLSYEKMLIVSDINKAYEKAFNR